MEIDKVIDEYIKACLLREKAMLDLKPKIANKYFVEIEELYKVLKEANKLEDLRPFLFHSSPSVKLIVATHLLTVDEITAIKVIKHLSETEKGEIGFTAKMTLKEWNKGNLNGYL